MPGIEIAALTKVFPNGVTALDGLDLSINDGEFFALLGPSGCGKTTLLRTIAGLEAATSGTIHIGARDVTGLQPGDRNLAMVFQDYALYPHMTVRDNIAYPLKIKHVGRAERNAEAQSAGTNLSLGHLMDRRPAQLSGGQQQRVALARAIATRPDVFLFDEPLSNLDARLRLEARTFLKQLQRELATTAIFVTHDQAEALALADRMAVMEVGRDPPGRHTDRTVPPSGQRVRRRVHWLDTDEPAARRRDGWRCRRRWNHPAAQRHDRRRRPSR